MQDGGSLVGGAVDAPHRCGGSTERWTQVRVCKRGYAGGESCGAVRRCLALSLSEFWVRLAPPTLSLSSSFPLPLSIPPSSSSVFLPLLLTAARISSHLSSSKQLTSAFGFLKSSRKMPIFPVVVFFFFPLSPSRDGWT